jgi:hypothetical protein
MIFQIWFEAPRAAPYFARTAATNMTPAPELVRRLLVSKQILGTPGLLTPHSDPIVIAQAILAAHDAAELAAAAIATVVGADIKEGASLMD